MNEGGPKPRASHAETIYEGVSREAIYEDAIQKTNNFSDLFGAIHQIGNISGTGEDYDPDKIIDYIERVRRGEMDIRYITRAYGLREKVRELAGI